MMNITPSTYKGAIGPLRHRCSHCQTCTAELRQCRGCLVVRYCNREHQTADWPRHKSVCVEIRRARARLIEEERLIRNAPENFMTPANAFETHVGRFWGLASTRDYMRARFVLAADLFLPLGTLNSVTEALQHTRDMTRLCRKDNMGVRDMIPAMMLRLDRDQECYDFVKWWATCDPDGRYDWGNMDLPHLNVRNADVFEHPGFLITKFPALNHVIAVLLLKLKLLVDIRNIRVARKAFADRSVPFDVSRLIETDLIRSPLSKRLLDESPKALIDLECKLIKQSKVLGATLNKENEHFMFNLFDPDEALSDVPEGYSPGSWEEMAFAMRYSYAAFWETTGVLPLLRDARLCAARDSEDEIAGMMEGPAFISGEGSSRTAEELLQDVSVNRIWAYLDDAVQNATYLGPWPDRPSERHTREARAAFDDAFSDDES